LNVKIERDLVWRLGVMFEDGAGLAGSFLAVSFFFFFFFFFSECRFTSWLIMPMSLEDFVEQHPMVTLSQVEYGHDFGLGRGIHVGTTPTQRVQSFVNAEGVPYRFMVVG
jgi:hypothetical protein